MKFIKITFSLILLFISTIGYAQSSVESLKKEIQTLTESLKTEKEKTNYFKDLFNLRNKGTEIIADSISIKIIDVNGDSVGKTITVKGFITHLGNTKVNLQFSHQQLTEPKGNIYDSYTAFTINNPKKDLFIEDVEKDTPYGFVILFNDVLEKMPTASLIRLQVHGQATGQEIKFNFKGIDINW